MTRYLRLYGFFLQFSFSRAMEFRVDFVFRILMDCLIYLVNFTFFKIIFLHTPTIGGLSEAEVMIFVSSTILMNAIVMTFLSNNFWWFPIFVNKGDLDYYLTRPISSKFFLGFRDIAANSFINIALAVFILSWTLGKYPAAIPIENYILYGLFLANGVYLFYLLRTILILPVFWTHSGRGFDEIFWSLGQAIERPDHIFSGQIRSFFTTFFPLALIASYPTRLLFEGPEMYLIVHMLIVTVIFTVIFHLLWNRALRNYSSASS